MQLRTRVRPFILTYMGTTLSWKSSVSWLREIFSFWNWTTGSRASSRMNINSLGMNHLISQEQLMLQHREFHRNQIWPVTYQLHEILNVPVLPQMNEFKFIFAQNSEKFEKWTWSYLLEGIIQRHETIHNSGSHWMWQICSISSFNCIWFLRYKVVHSYNE